MLFQVLFHCLDLAGIRRTKSSLVVDVDNIGILKMENHIGVMVAGDIHETECYRDEILTIPVELRPDIDARFRCVATWKLNHFKTSVEIERDYVGFPPVSLRNLKGIEQKTAHNAS